MLTRSLMNNEYKSLSGSWVLDKSRSDAMEPFLKCLNVAELAIEAQAKCETEGESRCVISIEGKRFAIHKRTKINSLTEIFELGVERTMPSRNGTRATTVEMKIPDDQSSIEIKTEMPIATGKLRLVETRSLMDFGRTCLQELDLTNLSTGEKCFTRRLWVRVPTTHDDRANLEHESTPLNCMPLYPSNKAD